MGFGTARGFARKVVQLFTVSAAVLGGPAFTPSNTIPNPTVTMSVT